MVDPNHSVTCAVCGKDADERKTCNLDPEAQWEKSPENFEMIGTVFVARHVFGSGEAHYECLEPATLLEYVNNADT